MRVFLLKVVFVTETERKGYLNFCEKSYRESIQRNILV